VFKSTDGGASWVPSNDGLMAQLIGSVFALELDPAAPETLYAGSLGVSKSTDAGTSWTPAESGLDGTFVGQTRTYVLAEVPRQDDRLPGRVDRQAFAAQ